MLTVYRLGGTEIAADLADPAGDAHVMRPDCDRVANHAVIPAEHLLAFAAIWLRDNPDSPAAARFHDRMAGRPVPLPEEAA